MKELKVYIPLCFLCKYFERSTSSYYKWLKQDKQKICEIDNEIQDIFKKTKGTYGSPRIYKKLLSQGFKVSLNTVAKKMSALGLNACLKKKFKVSTTNSKHNESIAPRLLRTEDCLDFTHPGKHLAGDITYIFLDNEIYYLSIVLDLFNRSVIGWSLDDNLCAEGVINSLNQAMNKRKITSETIFHSDRGIQYACKDFKKLLETKKIKQSMSRKGNCYDNAYVETWFKTMKSEFLYRETFDSFGDFQRKLRNYIENWYNQARLHSSLGYLSPKEYMLTNQKAA